MMGGTIRFTFDETFITVTFQSHESINPPYEDTKLPIASSIKHQASSKPPMGCGTSRSIPILHDENVQMYNMMKMMQEMMEQRVARQAQMVRDDPECKALLDRQIDLQSKGAQAAARGDQAALLQIQMEYMELCKHPKFMTMMMPEQHTFTTSSDGRTTGGFGMPMNGFGMNPDNQNGNNCNPFINFMSAMTPQRDMFHNTNTGNGIPMSFATSSNTNFGTTSNFGGPTTFYNTATTSPAYEGYASTSVGDSMFDSMQVNTHD